jgi:hypothetical protein
VGLDFDRHCKNNATGGTVNETLETNSPTLFEQTSASTQGTNKHGPLDELFSATIAYRRSESYLALLKFISRFPKYAPYNCFLLHMQNPEISYVATRDQWWYRFGRLVKDDARPLLILVPMGPVAFVYDLAATVGERLPRELERPFETLGEMPRMVLDLSVGNSRVRDRIAVVYKDFSLLHAGTAKRNDNGSEMIGQQPAKRIIELNSQLTAMEQYSTLVHELAHIHCGHVGGDPAGWWPDRRRLTVEQMEFEAESVSYLVCQRLRLKTTSAQYLAGYAGKHEEIPAISVETVLKATTYIESLGQKILEPRKPRQSRAAT